MEEAGDGRPEVASPALLEALLRSVLEGLRGNELAAFVREHPGAIRSLHRTLRDLRHVRANENVGVEAALHGLAFG